MTHPTDDELEAMAVRLDQSGANEYSYDNDKDEAAAMLRACKAGDAPDHGECMHPFCGDRCGKQTKKGQTND